MCRPRRSVDNVTLREVIARSDLDPALVEEVYYGIVSPPAEGSNVAREALFDSGLPPQIPATTINRYCAFLRRSRRRHRGQDPGRADRYRHRGRRRVDQLGARAVQPGGDRLFPGLRQSQVHHAKALAPLGLQAAAPGAARAGHQGAHHGPHDGPVGGSHGPRVQGFARVCRTAGTGGRQPSQSAQRLGTRFLPDACDPRGVPRWQGHRQGHRHPSRHFSREARDPAPGLLQGRDDHRGQRLTPDRRRLGAADDERIQIPRAQDADPGRDPQATPPPLSISKRSRCSSAPPVRHASRASRAQE